MAFTRAEKSVLRFVTSSHSGVTRFTAKGLARR